MSLTEMPVYRPTAKSIWTSFQNSGKRHLLLTGNRKSGKTTLLSSLFPTKVPGITTWAEPRKAVYLKDNFSSEVIRIGQYDDSLPGTENKMILCPEGLTSHGIPILQKLMNMDADWITIDEIGYLESGSPSYQDAIRSLMNKKQVVAVVRKQDLPFLQELLQREDVFVIDLDQPFGNYGCVIMASGLGKRFGGNKLMADFHKKPLIHQILKATEGIFTSRVVVTRHPDVADYCSHQNIPVILHDLPNRNDTVRLGLEALSDINGCMFCPGDQPLLTWDTVASLVLSAASDPHAILRTRFESTPGAPVLFPKWTFPELENLPEGKGGNFVVKKYPERVKSLPVSSIYELMDVDTREDLTLLQAHSIL